MSRIRGIEVKVQKEVLQTRKYGLNQILKKKNENQLANTKNDAEKRQINELLHKLPKLDNIFEVHRKIGEGTFSSVYLGSLKQHASLPDTEKRWFAIKHLVPTAHPARIEHELRCLQDMGGKHHVIGVELCLRNLDTIVFVMPYIPHKKFSDYVGDMYGEELRQYIQALLIALQHVHSFGVIHRDVKPSNFLYDRDNRRYQLVDFGLAQRLCPAPERPRHDRAPPPANTNGVRKRTREEDHLPPKRMALDLNEGRPVAANVGEAAPVSGSVSRCACTGVGGVCAACTSRPAPRAPRAGTQGFRPPEVLLKVSDQTTSVDMWACGVIMLCALTSRYPLLRAADDVTALAELTDILGTNYIQRAARALGRRVVMSSSRRGMCLRKLTARLRGAELPPEVGGACNRCRIKNNHCLCPDETKKPDEYVDGVYVCGNPDSAFSLVSRLLDPNPRTRISATDALQHTYITTVQHERVDTT